MTDTTILDLASAPWVGSILGLLGLLAALYFYRQSKRVARLAYQINEVAVVGGTSAAFPEDVEIRFAGARVPRVTSTRVIFWNAGNVTLAGTEIVASDPLRFEISSEGMVLRAELSQLTRPVNLIKLSRNEQEQHIVNIDFDYLDPMDGAVIEIFHSDGEGALKCHGTMRGLTGGVVNLGKADWSVSKSKRFHASGKWALTITVILIALTSTLFGVGLLFDVDLSVFGVEKGVNDFVGLGAILYGVAGVWLLWADRRRYPRTLAPRADSYK